jgi:hypothetical protein
MKRMKRMMMMMMMMELCEIARRELGTSSKDRSGIIKDTARWTAMATSLGE